MKVKHAYIVVAVWLLSIASPAYAHEGNHFGDGYEGLIVVGLSIVVGLGVAAFYQAQRSYGWGIAEAVIALSVATALVHLILGVQVFYKPFLLNAIGYFGLLMLHYWPPSAITAVRMPAYLGLILLTVATIGAYFVLEGIHFDLLSGLTLVVEFLLLGALCIGALQELRPQQLA